MRRLRLVATLTLGSLGPFLLAAAALSTLSGCVSFKRTPGARFFVLRSLIEAKARVAPVEGSIGLLPARIPLALDRPQLVAWTAPTELRLDELQRWAEPLDEGVTRTLAEDLAALLPGDRILRWPWPSSALPRCRVATELRVFGPQPDGAVRLEADVVLLAAQEDRVLARRSFAQDRKPSAAGAVASVDVMSELLAELARQIADAVTALPAPVEAPVGAMPTP
jgi:uncharacterized lipoprotein YmbA